MNTTQPSTTEQFKEILKNRSKAKKERSEAFKRMIGKSKPGYSFPPKDTIGKFMCSQNKSFEANC